MLKFQFISQDKTISVSIPEKWDEVTIGQLIQIQKIETIADTQLLSIISGIEEAVFIQAEYNGITSIIASLWWFQKMPEQIEPQSKFRHNDKDFELIEDVGNLPYGALEDLKKFIREAKGYDYLPLMISILTYPTELIYYRKWGFIKRRTTRPVGYNYNHCLARAKGFESLPVNIALSLSVFFFNRLESSKKSMQDFMKGDMSKRSWKPESKALAIGIVLGFVIV